MSAASREPVFESATKAVVSRFIYAVLAPIAKILIRYGWSVRDFADVARWVFVKVFYSTPEFWRFGRPTALQGAIKTGLPRQHVKKLSDIPEPQQALFTQRQNLACRVIEGWANDPEFQLDGKPAPLRLRHHPGPTFNKLVIKYGNDVTMGAVLGDLCDVGCVKVEGGIVTLVNQTYGINFLNEELLQIVGYSTKRLGETIEHNLTHKSLSERRMQRLWWQTSIPASRAGEAMAFLQEELVDCGRRIDGELGRKFSHEKPDEETQYMEVGFGIYTFQDEADHDSVEFQEYLMKRSTFK